MLVHTLTVGYFTYALLTKTGNTIANVLFLIISAFSLLYCLYTQSHKVDKKTNKKIHRYKGYIKRIVKIYQIVPMVAIILTTDTTNPITFLTIILSALMLAVQILLDILIIIIEKRANLFKEAFENDLEQFTKPFTATGDFFKKLAGKEVEEKEQSKHLDFLNEIAVTYEAEKKEKKALKKQEKKAKRQAFFKKLLPSKNDQDKNA